MMVKPGRRTNNVPETIGAAFSEWLQTRQNVNRVCCVDGQGRTNSVTRVAHVTKLIEQLSVNGYKRDRMSTECAVLMVKGELTVLPG